jgi:peptidoglycan-associated lipoprotein
MLSIGCSTTPRVRSTTDPRPPPSAAKVAPIPEPSIEVLQQLSDRNSLLSQRSVYYRNNSYTIAPQYQDLVQAHALFLQAHPYMRLRVEGNCDERGSSTLNLALGQRRADMIKKVLVMLGANAQQVTAVSLGSERPKVPERNEAARAENRRSDLLYIGVDTR